MVAECRTSYKKSTPIGAARFVWLQFALWLPACLILAVLVAWAAVVAQSYHFAPLVLFPLLVGVGLGALIVSIVRLGQVGNRPTVLAGTILAAAVAIAGQHYIGYLTTYHRIFEEVKSSQPVEQGLSELVESWTPGFAEFMLRQATRGRPLPGSYVAFGWIAWLTWAIDGLLVLAAVLAIVVPAMRLPYCNRCRSWYRVTRSGRIDVHIARRLAEVAEVCTDNHATSARYRLLNCNRGCDQTEFVLSWDESPGGTSTVRVWLDTVSRNRIIQVLDESKQ
jgi:hypothetical protein